MARAPVQNIPLNEKIAPVATPVDTFVRPEKSNGLLDLASSLSKFDEGLATFMQTRDKDEEEAQKLRGRARIAADADGSYAKMINDGTIPATESPFYVKGAKEALGAKQANDLRTDYQVWWDGWAGKDSDDPKAFEKGFGEFIKGRINPNASPDVLKGLLPGVEALQSNANTQYIQYRHDKTVTDRNSLGVANGLSDVDQGLDVGNTTPEGADYPKVFQVFNEHYANTVKDGDPGQKAEGLAIDAMAAKINERKDPSLLKWFDTKVPGKDYTWGQTVKGIETRNQVTTGLTALANSQQARLDAQEVKERKRLSDEATKGIIDGIVKDPDAPFDQKLLLQAQKNGNANILIDATSWRDTLTKGRPSDPIKLQGWYSAIISGEVPPNEALELGLKNGIFNQPADLTAAVGFVQSFKTNQAVIDKTMDSPQYKSYLEAMKVRTSAGQDLINPIAGVSNEGFEAQSDFRQGVARYILDHPKASPQEIMAETDRIGKETLGRITQGDLITPGEYVRPADMPFGNTFTGQKPGEADKGSGKVDPNQDIIDWEKQQKVTPEIKAQITEQAKRKGMSYEEFVRPQIKKQDLSKPGPNGLPVKPISYQPPQDLGEGDATTPVTREQAESWVDEAFSKAADGSSNPDAQRGALKALIRNGEADGNYNAVYGNPTASKDLSKFTLDQILGFQEDARSKGVKSTAIGAYGIIYKTLKTLKDENGFDGTAKFTPELQDKLADALLERRGLSAFREGKLSKKAFALSLSQEWAGLPSPETGRSFYDGDGLNASRIKTGKVFEALGFSSGSGYQPPGMTSYASLGSRNGGAKLIFDHPEQERGVDPKLKSVVAQTFAQLGMPEARITSGHRDADHPVEAAKREPGEHTKGDAMDLDMSGMSETRRQALVQRLIDNGVKRFITYSKMPNMMHIDLKDQNGDGKPYFMHDKSKDNMSRAPRWFQALRGGTTT